MSTIIMISGWVMFAIFAISVAIKTRKNPDGYIRINTSDPEKDTYTLELAIAFGELDERKDVKFNIIKE